MSATVTKIGIYVLPYRAYSPEVFFSVWRLPLTQIQIPVKKGKSSSKKYVTRPGESMLKWGLPSLLEDEGQHIRRCISFLRRIALKGTLRNDRSQVNLTMYNTKKYNRILTLPKVYCALLHVGWGGGGFLFMFPLRRIQNINSGSHRQRGYHEKT